MHKNFNVAIFIIKKKTRNMIDITVTLQDLKREFFEVLGFQNGETNPDITAAKKADFDDVEEELDYFKQLLDKYPNYPLMEKRLASLQSYLEFLKTT